MPAEAKETPYVVLLGGTVTTGSLDSDSDLVDACFDVVVVQMTHAPYIDLSMQHDMNIAILKEDAITLAEAILATANSLP